MWILNAIKSGDVLQLVTGLAVRLLIIFFVLPIHECAHGWAAQKLGDNTAKAQGRLTLNPVAHIDPFGALFLILFGFGWAKPVPINPYNFKNHKSGMALTALAGPASNLLVALLGAVIYNACIVFLPAAFFATVGYQILYYFFSWLILINISLAVFNLIPIPPLDGSRIFNAILPEKWSYQIARYERYIFIGLAVLIFSGVLDPVLSFLNQYALQGVFWIADLPFKLFGLL